MNRRMMKPVGRFELASLACLFWYLVTHGDSPDDLNFSCGAFEHKLLQQPVRWIFLPSSLSCKPARACRLFMGIWGCCILFPEVTEQQWPDHNLSLGLYASPVWPECCGRGDVCSTIIGVTGIWVSSLHETT